MRLRLGNCSSCCLTNKLWPDVVPCRAVLCCAAPCAVRHRKQAQTDLRRRCYRSWNLTSRSEQADPRLGSLGSPWYGCQLPVHFVLAYGIETCADRWRIQMRAVGGLRAGMLFPASNTTSHNNKNTSNDSSNNNNNNIKHTNYWVCVYIYIYIYYIILCYIILYCIVLYI